MISLKEILRGTVTFADSTQHPVVFGTLLSVCLVALHVGIAIDSTVLIVAGCTSTTIIGFVGLILESRQSFL